MSMNKVILQGALGADAEVRAMPNGGFVMNLRLVTNEKWKTASGEQKEHADWHSITQFFKESPRVAQYLTKGKAVLVEGKNRNESYEGKDGEKKYKHYVLAEKISFVSGKAGPGGGDHAESDGGGSSGGRSGGGGGYSRTGGNRGGQQSLPIEEPAGDGFASDSDLPF